MPARTLPLRTGSRVLPAVTVDTYNEELRDDDGFVGDRASRRAFRAILADWRERLKEHGEDPLGDTPTDEMSKAKLDKMMASDDPKSAALVHTVVEEFAAELATVVRRFMRLASWKDTERIVLGGGLIASRIGELAMGRASLLLTGAGIAVELSPIQNHPDEAGLIGSVQLAPFWILAGHDAILAADIGGTNVRVGIVELNADKRGSVAEADVWKRQHWRHFDDKPEREEAIDRIADMLVKLIERAEGEKVKLAPFMGIGCPGLIDEHGTILKGGQNLPGNWEGDELQPGCRAGQAPAADRRSRRLHPDPQRCRRAGPERGSEHEGRQPLGRHDHRHGPRQRPLHQPDGLGALRGSAAPGTQAGRHPRRRRRGLQPPHGARRSGDAGHPVRPPRDRR